MAVPPAAAREATYERELSFFFPPRGRGRRNESVESWQKEEECCLGFFFTPNPSRNCAYFQSSRRQDPSY